MSRKEAPLFLARQSYRRRRLGDAARTIPVLAAVLFTLPVLWAEDALTHVGLIYLFTVWVCLIVVMALITRRLGTPSDETDVDDPGAL